MDTDPASGARPPVLALHVDDLPERRIAPGIVRRDLPATGRACGWLIDFAPGSRWPHVDTHDAEERYYVLSGEVIEDGRRHGPGTYVVFAPGSSHRPRSETGARILGIDLLSP
ncbi:cupin domain-containing protein [Streptomyces sp. NPDC001443]